MPHDGPLRAGQLLASTYRVDKPLGVGGYAVVYAAHREADEMPVVIKALRREASEMDPSAVERFIRGAAVAARVDHPNIVRILNFGQNRDGVLYIVMERLYGRTLVDAMFYEPIPPLHVREVIRQILRALVNIHKMGIIHRDLKPSNVFVCNSPAKNISHDLTGHVIKLLDFGFVKMVDGDNPVLSGRLTQAGVRVGTPGYMAPETLTLGEITPLSDLYAVGIIGYELLTAEQAFEGEGMDRVIAQIDSDPAEPEWPIVNYPIYAFIERLTEREPKHRYADAAEALHALESLAAEEAPTPEQSRRWYRFWQSSS